MGDTTVDNDFEYTQINSEDEITLSASGGGLYKSGSVTIDHTVGEVPQFKVWYDPDKDGSWWVAIQGDEFGAFGPKDPWLDFRATSTQLEITLWSFSAQTDVPIFYRIYEDESV